MLRARHCQFCADSISATRRIDAKYCRDSCKKLASQQRKTAGSSPPAERPQQPSALVELVMRLEAQEAAARSQLVAMWARIAELEASAHRSHRDPDAHIEPLLPQPAPVRQGSGRFKNQRVDCAENWLRVDVQAPDPQAVSLAENFLLSAAARAPDPQPVVPTENLLSAATPAMDLQSVSPAEAMPLRAAALAPHPQPVSPDGNLLSAAAPATDPQRVAPAENLLRSAAALAPPPQPMAPVEDLRSAAAPAEYPKPVAPTENYRSAAASAQEPQRGNYVDTLLRSAAAKDPQRSNHVDHALRSAAAKDPPRGNYVDNLLQRAAAPAKDPPRRNHVDNLLQRAAVPVKGPPRAALTHSASSAHHSAQQHTAAREDRPITRRAPAKSPQPGTPTTRPVSWGSPRGANEQGAAQRSLQYRAQTGNPTTAKASTPPARSPVALPTSQRSGPAPTSDPMVEASDPNLLADWVLEHLPSFLAENRPELAQVWALQSAKHGKHLRGISRALAHGVCAQRAQDPDAPSSRLTQFARAYLPQVKTSLQEQHPDNAERLERWFEAHGTLLAALAEQIARAVPQRSLPAKHKHKDETPYVTAPERWMHESQEAESEAEGGEGDEGGEDEPVDYVGQMLRELGDDEE